MIKKLDYSTINLPKAANMFKTRLNRLIATVINPEKKELYNLED
jgi:hypothetical protein